MIQKIEIYGEFPHNNLSTLVEDIATVLEDKFDCELAMISRIPYPDYEEPVLESEPLYDERCDYDCSYCHAEDEECLRDM